MRNTNKGNHLSLRVLLLALLLAVVASAQVRINSDAQLPGAGVGQVYNTTIIAAGGTGPYTFQVTTGSLPGGLTLQPNGQITGSPNAAGTANFTITATDANLVSAPKQFSLPVAATPLTLQVTGNSTSVGLGRYVELGFAGQGGLGPYRYRWVSGSTLPPGVVFDKQTTVSGPFPQGFTRIRGTPRTAGTFPGVMEVIDSQERVAQANFTFTVTSDPLALPGASLPDGRRFIPYSFQLAATGGFAPIQYEQVGGSLPPGLTVRSDGRVEGTATGGLGPFNFSVTAIDANGVSVVQAYTMTMVNPPSLLIATPPVLPTGVVGISYLTVIRKDDANPFPLGLFSITSGSLPPGLGIGSDSGEISGTPTTPGVYNFQVTNDDGGTLLQKDFTLTISPTLFEWTSYPIKFLQAGQFIEMIDATVETAGGTPVGPVRHIAGSWGPAFSSTPFNCCVVGTPPASTVYGFLASVTAQDGQVAQRSFTAEISAVQPLIALNPASPPQGLLGQRYRFHESGCNPICTNKGGGHPYRWSLSSGTLPTGLTLAPDGEISGIPTQSGAFFITLQLTDAYGSSVSQGYDLLINSTSGSLTMTTTSPLPQGTINTPYSTNIQTTGGTAPVTFTVTGGTTPPGLTLAPNGTLSGTPTLGGNYNFTVSAFDSSPASGGGPLGVSRAFSLFIFAPTPPPTLSQIIPNTIVEGSAGFTLTAIGTDFSSPTILWNGSPLTTSPGGVPTEITASVPAGLVAAAGIAQVTVRNGDLQVSAPRPFTITPRPPLLTSISPTQVNAGGPAFLLTATGQFFTASAPGPVILFGGVPLTTQSFSSTQVQAMVPANLITNGGVVSVRIQNQDLQESNSQQLSVGNPPVLNSISPTLVATASGSFTITATGSNFTAAAPGATIIFDGTPLPTSSFSTTQVQATVPANLITSQGLFEVWVRNQDLQDSNVQILQVATPPVLSTINPTQVIAGGPAFLLTATGTNFTTAGPGAVILFNGTPLTTSSFSGTQVQATVLASQITTPGVATIRVRNQTGQESNAVSLTIGSPPVLNSINPTLVATGSGSFTITATGSNFTAAAPGATILFDGTPLTTSSFSGTQVQATVPANLITSQGQFEIRVRNQDLQESNAQLLQVATPPVLSTINPTQVNAGGPSFLLTATGTNFTTAAPGAVILFNGTPLTTSSFSGTQVQATVLASQITTAGVATIRVRNQTGQESNAVLLSIGSPPVLNSINPTLVATGSGAFTLTATGTNFTPSSPGAVVLFNGSPLNTVSFGASQVQATVPANLLTSPGVAAIRVRNQDQQESNTTNLVIAAPPVLTSLTPQSAIAGSPALTLTLNGANFDEGLQVLWNGTPVPSVTNQGDRSTATIAANLLATPGTATVQVRASNGLTSQTLVFPIQPQVSTITRLLPDTIASGSPTATITLEGTNFRNDSVALFDGQALTTFADSATSIRAVIDADRLSRPGAFPITVRSPQGTLSNAVNLTVTGPGPQITALDPPNRQVGSPSFVLTVDGAGFEVLSVIRFNGVALSTDFFSSSRLRATVPANLLQVTGSVPVLVENPNGLRSAPRQFAIRLPAPVIRSLVPSSVPAGSGPTQILVDGTDFQSGAVVVVQGTDLVTTGPGNRLTATVPANLLAVAATLAVTVRNPDGQSAVAVDLTVTGTAPGPQITSLAPTGIQAGGGAFVLTVNGANFQSGATVLWGTAALPTTFGSATQLTAQVTADRVAAPGSVAVTVRNPDGRTSAAVAFVISALPAPVLSSLSPTTATAGAAPFVLTLNGSGFQPGASARWQGQDLPTSYVSATQVTATVTAQRIASAGQFEVTLRNPDGQVSNPLTFTVQAATPPVITSVSPNETVTGLASLLLDVRGQQFQAGALLLWNGEPLASTTVVSANQLQAVVDQQRLQVPGSATLQVRNPNGQVSNAVPFVLRFVLPRLLSMAPLAALAGATEVTLNLTVENVRNGAVVTWNGASLPTVLTGPNQMTAQVLPAALLAQPGSANVAVRNPDGLSSNSITFVILAPRPVISRIAPDRVIASQPDVRLQVFGSGFRSGVQIRLGGVPVTTSFLNNGELLVFVPVDRIAVPGAVSVQAVNTDGQSSDAVQLTVLPSLTPELTGLTPGFIAVGSGNTLVTVAGRNFVPGTRVLVEGALAETRYVSETQLEVQVPQQQLGFARALQLTVRNPDGKTSSPRALTVGEPLRITAIELPSGVVGLAYRYAFRATGGVPDYRWTTDSTLPAGLTLSPEGVLSGTPTGPPATTALLVRVTDTAGNTERAQAPLVIESADLEILSVSPLPPTTAGDAYSFQFQARATAGLPLVWSVVEGTLPAGLELNAATGRITGIAAEPPEPVATTEASRAASVPVVFAFGVEVSALGRNPSRRTFELTVLPATGEFRITTPAPLAPGTVRRPYALSFATAGGTLPVSITLSGRLPAGMSLGADGRLTGVPEEAGTFPLTVQARDAAQRLTTRAYEWQVRATAEGPEILSGPLLPITGGPAPMDVLIEARGGRRPFTWSIIAGSLPPGIRFDPVTARLTGTPLQTGVFRFTVRVLDADGLQDLRVIELPVTATGEPLQLVTQTLPGVGAGVPYNAALEARGGMPPYRFAVAEGSLPAGLSLVGAQIQGVPTVPGTSTFRLRLTDEIGFVLHRDFTITTTLAVVPALSITGLPDRIEPGSQPRVGLQLAAPFPLDLVGNLGLTFVSDPPVAGVDPALQFSSGGRTVAFRIPAGQTEAVFPQATLALQTGTVAGVLTAAITGLQAGATAAPTANRPDRTVQITHLPPVIREALFEATPTGFTMTVTGFSTTREVQEAVVTLTPAPGQQLQSTTLVVPLAAVFRQWYDSAASLPFGTQFRLALPFNATGGAVQSATIRLRNSVGESR